MYEVMRDMHVKRRKIFEKAFEDEIQQQREIVVFTML